MKPQKLQLKLLVQEANLYTQILVLITGHLEDVRASFMKTPSSLHLSEHVIKTIWLMDKNILELNHTHKLLKNWEGENHE